MAAMIWKNVKTKPPPKDGRRLLLIARLNIDGAEAKPMVGYWDQPNNEWRPEPHEDDLGTELVVSYWTDIPELPPEMR